MSNFWNTPIEVRTDTLIGFVVVFSVFVWYCFDYYDGVREHQNKFDKWRVDNDKYRSNPENQLREYFIHLQKMEQLSSNSNKIKLN